jgi:hypothetical protein
MKIKLPGFPVDDKMYYTLIETSSADHQSYVGMKYLPDRKLEEGVFVEFSAKDRYSSFPLFVKELIVGGNPETLEIRNLKGFFIFKISAASSP